MKRHENKKGSKSQRGASLIEYILLLCLIAVVIIPGLHWLGEKAVKEKFNNVSAAIEHAGQGQDTGQGDS